MKLEWMGNHRALIEKMIKYGNAYSNTYKRQFTYGTNILLTASQIQTLEYIIEADDEDQKMSEMAERLGVSRSAFSKNVKNLAEKGLLEKYRLSGNRKDIYVKPSSEGYALYQQYTEYILKECFDDMFHIANRIPESAKEDFMVLLDRFSDTLIHFSAKKETPQELVMMDEE
ncbi:MarR family transcriptional regulator [Metasolibacillus meyeri]|uniref:MarR family transcriptional regulator n=1 Tax=Metasolibacillus meyeri TaxID=1071052 RepID=A0AAW9NXF8_9BACL|nr:MarR family transcriptional regulator [Metasolibacillus meyeri]MEC1179876.1 MarR family transcriptional regulator [Metasolibacillus meyeri]